MNIHCPVCESDALVPGKRRLLDHWTAVESAQCNVCSALVSVPMQVKHIGQSTPTGLSSRVSQLVSTIDGRAHDWRET